MATYLVGGAVRDQLLGRPVGERDWVVVGVHPTDMEAAGNLLSLHGAFSLIIDRWIYGDPAGLPVWSPFIVLAALFGAGVAVIHWRLQRAGDIH